MRFPKQTVNADTQRAAIQSPQAGPIAFILKRGVFRFGLIMFIFSTLYIRFVIKDHGAMSLSRIKITAPLCLFMGLAWGTLLWFQAALKHKQMQRSE